MVSQGANVHAGAEFGIDAAMAGKMGSAKSLEAMERPYPELRKRGLRVLSGGDYGYPTTAEPGGQYSAGTDKATCISGGGTAGDDQ
ncbi:hypothetical protein [Amycolatopsis nalaikhensis]|uniref:Amidohydrolase n=1 Tax=Amycolatopsis nalaikhensis TaxID=715472 RepID=A0ABY8XU51_9PSEU|nr:hypothetical protein [Amycolatopsis sp. 2-2]WIV59128.1 hypothetical protein QP939_11105 [Amycolatopsis sp. 2-2]